MQLAVFTRDIQQIDSIILCIYCCVMDVWVGSNKRMKNAVTEGTIEISAVMPCWEFSGYLFVL